LRTLTEFGADVGFVSEQAAGRYIDGINEAREVHPHYGRAVHYSLPLTNDQQVQEVLGRVVGSLGRMDALIDTTPMAWGVKTDPQAASQICLSLAEKLIPFFLAKQRGRIVYICEDPALKSLQGETIADGCREILTSLVENLGEKYRGQNVTVNALSVGVTDDYILRAFPGSTSLKRSFEELRRAHPSLKLVDTHDISMSVAYLTSALCASLTGQTLRLTHGFHLNASATLAMTEVG
jgi:NADP-dependent 3-hydroxy acid dehydrogenase YdfG